MCKMIQMMFGTTTRKTCARVAGIMMGSVSSFGVRYRYCPAARKRNRSMEHLTKCQHSVEVLLQIRYSQNSLHIIQRTQLSKDQGIKALEQMCDKLELADQPRIPLLAILPFPPPAVDMRASSGP